MGGDRQRKEGARGVLSFRVSGILGGRDRDYGSNPACSPQSLRLTAKGRECSPVFAGPVGSWSCPSKGSEFRVSSWFSGIAV